jgi:hypothetical protein
MDEMNETMKFCNKREFNEMNEISQHGWNSQPLWMD